MTDTVTGTIDREALNRYVGFILALHEERKQLNADIAARYEEAKNAGFVTKIIRAIVREQQMEADERQAHYNLMDTYRHALGMISDLPLGIAALEAEAKELAETMRKPRPFAEQSAKRPPGRPRKRQSLDELLDQARQSLSGEPAGTA
jgi:uncharacterized protein (UPF0335 family)